MRQKPFYKERCPRIQIFYQDTVDDEPDETDIRITSKSQYNFGSNFGNCEFFIFLLSSEK